jgi:hypothetical protein
MSHGLARYCWVGPTAEMIDARSACPDRIIRAVAG